MRRFCVAIVSLIALLSVFQAKAVDGSPAYLTGRTATFHVTSGQIALRSTYTAFYSVDTYNLTRVSGNVKNATNVSYSYLPTPNSTNATIFATNVTLVSTSVTTTTNSTNTLVVSNVREEIFSLGFGAPLAGNFTNQITTNRQTNFITVTDGLTNTSQFAGPSSTTNQSGTFSLTDLTFDFNQDGAPDFLWQNFSLTNMTKTTNPVPPHVVTTNFGIADTGGTNFAVWELPTNIITRAVFTNLNSNITADLTITNFNSRFSTGILTNAAKLGQRILTNTYPAWQPIGQADFDNNGIVDLVSRGQTNEFHASTNKGVVNFAYTSTNECSFVIVSNVSHGALGNPGPIYHTTNASLVGLGNFTGGADAAGHLEPDFLLVTTVLATNNTVTPPEIIATTNSHLMALSFSNLVAGPTNLTADVLGTEAQPVVRASGTSFVPASLPTSMGVAGIADVNGDGWSDIIFTNRTGSALTVWFMKGLTNTSRTVVTNSVPSANIWKFQGIADFDHDGHPDFVYRSPVTDRVIINFMNGLQLRNTAHIIGPPAEWNIVAPK